MTKRRDKLPGSSSTLWGGELSGVYGAPVRPIGSVKKRSKKSPARRADAVRVETPRDPASLAAIWPHVRPVTGLVCYADDVHLGAEVAALWSGDKAALWGGDRKPLNLLLRPRIVVLRPPLWDMTARSDLQDATALAAPVGGTVAALLPLAALRLYADWMIDHRPDVYVLPSLWQGHTSGWFVWAPDRGRGRLRFLRIAGVRR